MCVTVNSVVGTVAVPYIALIDGVTMGGVSDGLCSAFK